MGKNGPCDKQAQDGPSTKQGPNVEQSPTQHRATF